MNIISSLIIFYIIFGTTEQRDAVFNGLIILTIIFMTIFLCELIGFGITYLYGAINNILR